MPLTDEVTDVQIVCPWCAHYHRDSWDWGDADLVECERCGKPIAVTRETVTYYTARREGR